MKLKLKVILLILLLGCFFTPYVRSQVSPFLDAFTDLFDTPNSYSGQASKVLSVNAGETALEFTAGAGGVAITLDLGDDGGNDSVDLNEIATTGDTNSIFTEPTADKLLIAVGNNWPTADTATALAANGANAASGSAILGVDASGAAEGAFDVWTEAENTAAGYISATLTQEEVEDYAGALIGDGTGTHTGIAVTYQDATGDVDMIIDHDAATNFLAAEHVDWAGASAGTIHTDNYIEGGAGTDTTAIHDNVASEITAITEKTSPVCDDEIIIEDSENSNNKKSLKICNLFVEHMQLQVRNETGVSIAAGKVVYMTGFNNVPLIALADNTDNTKDLVLGVTLTSIAHEANGVIATAGEFSSDTNGFTAVGDILYLSTSGTLTETKPTSGAVIIIGIVTVKQVNGKILLVHNRAMDYIAATSGTDVDIRMGATDGTTKISFENYSDSEVASITDQGLISTLVGLDGIGAVALTIGSGDITSMTFTTDGTGNAEFTFPADVIGADDIDWGAGAGQIDMDDMTDGSTNAAITLTQETNFTTAYTHSQDNTQAHSDYLLNSGSDTMAGTLTADGLTLGQDENITLGAQTLDHDGTDFVFNDSIKATTLEITGGQIVFPAAQSASANANTLDDYEEGTWTPALDGTTGGNATYTTQTGSYVKIGNLVFLRFEVKLNVAGAGTGDTRITGIPFSVTGNGHSLTIGLYIDLAAGLARISGYIAGNTIYITGNTGAATSDFNAVAYETYFGDASKLYGSITYID